MKHLMVGRERQSVGAAEDAQKSEDGVNGAQS